MKKKKLLAMGREPAGDWQIVTGGVYFSEDSCGLGFLW